MASLLPTRWLMRSRKISLARLISLSFAILLIKWSLTASAVRMMSKRLFGISANFSVSSAYTRIMVSGNCIRMAARLAVFLLPKESKSQMTMGESAALMEGEECTSTE